MSENYSKAIADVIRSYLEGNGFKQYQFDEEDGTFRFINYFDSKINSLSYVIDVMDDSYIIHTMLPIGADDETLEQMCWFICCANCGLNFGNFELNPEDGEVSFKYSVSCRGGIIPPPTMVRESILLPFFILKKYMPGIISVLFENMDGKEACQRCEHSYTAHPNTSSTHLTEAILKMLADRHDDSETESDEETEEESVNDTV